MELHGGTLRVQSTKGEGTKFETVLSIDERASKIVAASPSGPQDRGCVAGADEYLAKPIVLKDLGIILRRAAMAIGKA